MKFKSFRKRRIWLLFAFLSRISTFYFWMNVVIRCFGVVPKWAFIVRPFTRFCVLHFANSRTSYFLRHRWFSRLAFNDSLDLVYCWGRSFGFWKCCLVSDGFERGPFPFLTLRRIRSQKHSSRKEMKRNPSHSIDFLAARLSWLSQRNVRWIFGGICSLSNLVVPTYSFQVI